MAHEVKDLYDAVPYSAFADDYFPVVKALGLDKEGFAAFAKGKDVMEVGSGGGQISVFLSHYFASVTGADISTGSLEASRQRVAENGVTNANFVQADLFDDAFIEKYAGRFDMVICYGVLHHTKDPRGGYKRLVKLLKPGGTLLIGVYSRTQFPYRIRRAIVLLLAGKDWEKRERIANRLWFKNKGSKVALFDGYVHPQVSFHSIGGVRAWVTENKLSYTGSWPPFETKWYWRYLPQSRLLTELIWILSGKSVMVSVAAKKPLEN